MIQKITISNYRGFSQENPVTIDLTKGDVSFVGPNNTGKSSLLKFFYEFRSIFSWVLENTENQAVLKEKILQSRIPIQIKIDSSNKHLFPNLSEIFCNLNNGNIEIQFEINPLVNKHPETPDSKYFPNMFKVIIDRPPNHAISQETIYLNWRVLIEKVINIKKNIFDFSRLRPRSSGNPRNSQVIQLEETSGEVDLSPLHFVFQQFKESYFIGPFRHILNTQFDSKYFDMLIGKQLIIKWDELKNSPDNSLSRKAIQITNDIKQIFGFESLEINASVNKDNLKVIINGNSHNLNEIGSGIAHFILSLVNLSINTEEVSFILIDEPELNLHPTLQQKFIDLLRKQAKDCVVFSTHSIGLARSEADIIYLVTQTSDGVCHAEEKVDSSNLVMFLGELGYANGYHELGFERVLLVEGVTEVKTIKEFLKLYNKDSSTLIIQLGGDSMTNGHCKQELEELTRIHQNIFALVDSERNSESEPPITARVEFASVCSQIGIQCHILNRKATENYFTDSAIKSGAGQQYRALKPFEKLSNIVGPNGQPQGWPKKYNWRIASHMKQVDLQGTDLHEFLENILD